jgi:hypothetical protein
VILFVLSLGALGYAVLSSAVIPALPTIHCGGVPGLLRDRGPAHSGPVVTALQPAASQEMV